MKRKSDRARRLAEQAQRLADGLNEAGMEAAGLKAEALVRIIDAERRYQEQQEAEAAK
jgi:hypothetical protein